MKRLNRTESVVFLYCRFSISEGSVFQIILGAVSALAIHLLEGDLSKLAYSKLQFSS